MAVSAAQVTVTTSATALNTASTSGQWLVIANQAGAAVFLGPSNVTTATGLSVAASSTLATTVFLAPGEVLYGIVTTGTQVVHVLRTGT